jgi:hypothetical protein
MASFRRGADDLGDTELDDRPDRDCCRRDCEVMAAAAFAQLAVKVSMFRFLEAAARFRQHRVAKRQLDAMLRSIVADRPMHDINSPRRVAIWLPFAIIWRD